MNGIGIEFMTGAMLLSSIRIVSFLFFVWIVCRIVKKAILFVNDENNDKTLNIKWEIFGIAAIFLFTVFFGTAAQPRLTIEVPQDRELIQYQRNADEIVIETPPPRTETLDGFTPLNE